jgi:hypothetical protein
MEDSTNDVRSVRSLLARFESGLNLWPLGIGSDCDKVRCKAKEAGDGHRILEELEHVACAARMGGRKDDSMADLSRVLIVANGIDETLVAFCTNGPLICPDPVESQLLVCSPVIDQIL